MGRLLLLRHGQAAFGAADYDQLSALGAQQAHAAGVQLARGEAGFSRVLCGPRRRHRLTLHHAAAGAGAVLTPVAEPCLDEFAEGSALLAAAARRRGRPANEGMDRASALRAYLAELDAWAAGEPLLADVTPAHVFRRTVSGWLAAVTREARRGERVLAVTSAGVIAAVVAEVLGLPTPALGPLVRVVLNASLTEVLFSGERRSLHAFNAAGHLPPALRTYV